MKKYVIRKKYPIIAYASSMIQQNHGEELKGHGFLLWDLKRKLFKHYELQNDYGFYTVEINKGKLITDISDIPKKARIRTKCFESIPSQVKEIINEIKEKCEILESTFIRIDEHSEDKQLINNSIVDIHNILNVDYQNKLIEENLSQKNIEVDLIEKVKELNKTINVQIPKDKTPKNIRWKPKTFEFDNMFSYGEGNFIDFTKLKGTIGLFAPNASGKSSIMDALAFCIFDKFSKGYKASHVLNTQKMSFKCKFNFEVSGVDYFIEREGKSDKKGNVKVDVKFYKIEKEKEVPLNGEARRSTNDIIRDYVGSYDDFILTVLSVQNGKNGSFIDLGQTERKDLLCQFMGLNLFDQLYNIANENFKETNTLLKNVSKDKLNSDLDIISGSINTNNDVILKLNEELKQLETTKESFNNKLLELSNNIIKTGSFDFNISELEAEKINLENKIESVNKNINDNKLILSSTTKDLEDTVNLLLDYNDIENQFESYKEWKQKEDVINNKIEKLKLIIKTKVDKLKKLEEHKYDPNCNYCINNIFVKDAIKTKEELEVDKNEAKILVEEFTLIKNKLDSFGDIEVRYKNSQKLNEKKNNLENNKSTTNNKVLQLENSLLNLNNKLKEIKEKIEVFYKNKDIIENNNKLLKEINELKLKIKSLENEIKTVNGKLINVSTEKGKLELQYKNIIEQLSKIKELENSYEAYKLYTSVVSRDGIPYEVITRTLPEIEKEVNNILHQIVEFTISLSTDGKNIMTNIVYDDKNWPLEMASGMEKFVSGLAIRVALINISNLPRPNIICIDEGWGTMDSTNLSSVGAMLSFLKTSFDFIWVISHIDSIKDSVDKLVEITKVNGLSHVEYK